ncbi:hypothetical protein ACFFRR_002453 [Megaselia abdita]
MIKFTCGVSERFVHKVLQNGPHLGKPIFKSFLPTIIFSVFNNAIHQVFKRFTRHLKSVSKKYSRMSELVFKTSTILLQAAFKRFKKLLGAVFKDLLEYFFNISSEYQKRRH